MGRLGASTFDHISTRTGLHRLLEFRPRFVALVARWTNQRVSSAVYKIHQVDRYAKHIEFSPLLNGIGVVFSDGTSGLIICETSKFEPQVGIDTRPLPSYRCLPAELPMYRHSTDKRRENLEDALLRGVECHLSAAGVRLDEVSIARRRRRASESNGVRTSADRAWSITSTS